MIKFLRRLAIVCAISVPVVADEISFADVLANPADPQLNIRYAEQQIGQQDLLGALAALERVLLVQPGNIEARLLAIRVRLWLGNYEDARSDLAAFEGIELPSQIQSAVNVFNSEVLASKQTSTLSGVVSTQLWRSSNVGQYPSEGVSELSGQNALPVYADSEGNTAATRANGLTTDIGLRYSRRLASPTWESVNLQLNLSKTIDDKTNLADQDVVSVGLSSTAKFVTGQLVPQLSFTQVEPHYAEKQRLASLGASFTFSERPLGLFVSATRASVNTNPTARSKDYKQYVAGINGNILLDEKTLIAGRLSTAVKRAVSPNQAVAQELTNSNADSLSLDLIRALPHSIRLRLGLTHRHTRFQKQYSLEPRKRVDRTNTLRAGLTHTLPFGLGQQQASVSLAYSRVSNRSNLKTYTYKASRYSVTLNQPF